MVVEDFPNFLDWIGPALLTFALVVGACAVGGICLGFLVAAIRHGPAEAFYSVAGVIARAGPDFLHTSPRRVLTIARLALKETFRRRVLLVAFSIFALALLFGGWFLNAQGEHPDRIYISFVMWGTQILVLLLAMLISAFSLPEDIRNHTIYTVVTKPVRSTEIVLGRILGFIAAGTLLLAAMGVISLLFVWRGLSHSHTLDLPAPVESEFSAVDEAATGRRPSAGAISEAWTTENAGHRHLVEIIEEVRPRSAVPPTEILRSEPRGDYVAYYRPVVRQVGSHSHSVRIDKSGDEPRIALTSDRGFFRARVPVYASELVFVDRAGEVKDRGVSVGDIWTYRGYIDGGVTLSRAEFLFDNFTAERFAHADVIPLEMTLAVFRSHTGSIREHIKASIQFESVPDDPQTQPKYVSEPMEFESDEHQVQVKGIERALPGELIGPDRKRLASGYFDLFDDFAANGRLKLVLRCVDQNQYIGVAKADVYFRAADGMYAWNFAKAYFGIWLQMAIITALGVALSTLLNTPVVILGVVCAIIFGFFSGDIQQLVAPQAEGGGPVESLVRLITQKNMQEPLEASFFSTLVKEADKLLIKIPEAMTHIVPNFARMDFSNHLTYGYNIDANRWLTALMVTISFCLGAAVLGYFCLRTRELAG